MNFENQKLELLKQKHYSNNIFENKKKKIEDINNTLVPISKKENFIKTNENLYFYSVSLFIQLKKFLFAS